MASTLSQAIGRTIRNLMTDRRITELALAESAGIPRTTLRVRLAGGGIKSEELDRIAAALDMSPSELVARAEKDAA